MFRIAVCLSLIGLCACERPPMSDLTDAGLSEDADAGALDGGLTPSPTMVFLNAQQQPVLTVDMSEVVSVLLSGLAPKSAVTLEAEMTPWKSSAIFTVADDGTVNTARDESTGGSYLGVDADGLFWSMSTPVFELAQSANVTFRVQQHSQVILQGTLVRSYAAPAGTRIITPQGVSFVGKLVIPPGRGPFPTLLAFGGSEGGLSGGLSYADELVPQGYAVLALAYFREAGLPTALKNLPLEYFDGAMDWVRSRPEVDATRLGVIGASRGGELALLLASRYPELRAAVADAPSGYVWGSTVPPGAAWASHDAGLPFIPWNGLNPQQLTTSSGTRAWALTPVFEDDIRAATDAQKEAARIPIENAGAAVALFAGADDQLWPSCAMARVAYDKLAATGHAQLKGDTFDCFEDAGHLVTSVGFPTTSALVSPGPNGELMALGGTPAGIARAGRIRQGKVREFLGRTLAQE